MCGWTWVGSPARSARRLSSLRTWLALSRVPRVLTSNAVSSSRAQPPRNASQASTAFSAVAPIGHAAPLAAFAQDLHAVLRSVDPAARARPHIQAHEFRHAQPAAVQQFDDATDRVRRASAALRGRWTRTPAGRPAPSRDRPRAPWQRLGGARAFTASTGFRLTRPSLPSQRYRPRQADSVSAMLRGPRPRACRLAAQRRTW